MRHDVQVANGLEETCKHPKLLVLADLLQVGLGQPFPVLAILLVRSLQNRLSVLADAFTLDDRHMLLRMVAEVQLVRPTSGLLAGADIDCNSHTWKSP